MYTVVTGCVKAVNTWLASLVWPDQFLQLFLKLCMCKDVRTPYKFLARNHHVVDVHIYVTINAHIIHTCAAAPRYNSSSYLTMDTVTDSITDSTAQDDTLKKPPQPVNHNLTHLWTKENSVPCLPTSGNGYTTHKAQDVI